jgi:hypothetical protein
MRDEATRIARDTVGVLAHADPGRVMADQP